MHKLGNIDICWNNDYKDFEYTKQPLMDEEITKWRSLGYYHESFSGDMYDSKNPMPDWVNTVAEQIGLENCGYVFYRMSTLDIMPEHVDHFNTYTKVFEVNREDVYRALLFLEDWKPGQYLDVEGDPIVNWKAGDYLLWSADAPHSSSNIGVDLRYALQITGTLINGRHK